MGRWRLELGTGPPGFLPPLGSASYWTSDFLPLLQLPFLRGPGGISPGRLAKKETWELSDLAQFREGQQSALISERFTSGEGGRGEEQGEI